VTTPDPSGTVIVTAAKYKKARFFLQGTLYVFISSYFCEE
jgi:hypothetical protein